ncbi:MAG: hypothetical protein ACRC14_14935 [Paracoccaceae bacterium]
MPGTIGSGEIGDVVASLRRLMSEDTRSRPMSRDLGQDRLVLTPALQVRPETSEADPLIQMLASRKDGPVADVLFLKPDMAGDVSSNHGMKDAFEAEWEDEIWAEPEPPLAEIALGLEDAEVVPDLPVQDAPVEAADGVGSFDDEAPWADIGEDWLDEQNDALDPILVFAANGRVRTETPPDAADQPERDEVEATPPVADVEGSAEEPSLANRSAGLADAAPRLGVLELSAADLLTDGEGNPLTVLDEAALQQIIRELIREELKGGLGEKITQSVRKLVRAEINRALAAHSLD